MVHLDLVATSRGTTPPVCLPRPSLFLGFPAVCISILGWQVTIKTQCKPALVKSGNALARTARQGGEQAGLGPGVAGSRYCKDLRILGFSSPLLPL